MQALKLFIKQHIECRESEVDLTITNPITSNNVFKSLIDLSVAYYPRGDTLYSFSIITSIMWYSETYKLLASIILLFHLYLYNFTQICFGFLKKTLWLFPMVFYGKPTPSISEPTSVQGLLYIKTNDPKIDHK